MPDTINDAQEHPIIFNEWSIQRILAGEKTQTRRIVKPQPPDNADRVEIERGGTLGYFSGDTAAFHDTTTCPYGQPGDVLWVREAFRLPKEAEGLSPTEYLRGDQWDYISTPYRYVAGGGGGGPSGSDLDWGRKRPPIHMPKELCRLRLRVEDVRVERVQEINKHDAEAEGVASMLDDVSPLEFTRLTYIEAFQHKWDKVHGDGAWERNDWVWAIEFARYDE